MEPVPLHAVTSAATSVLSVSLCILLSEHLFAQVLEDRVGRKKREEKGAGEVPAAGARESAEKKITKWLFLSNVFMQLLIPEHIPS